MSSDSSQALQINSARNPMSLQGLIPRTARDTNKKHKKPKDK